MRASPIKADDITTTRIGVDEKGSRDSSGEGAGQPEYIVQSPLHTRSFNRMRHMVSDSWIAYPRMSPLLKKIAQGDGARPGLSKSLLPNQQVIFFGASPSIGVSPGFNLKTVNVLCKNVSPNIAEGTFGPAIGCRCP